MQLKIIVISDTHCNSLEDLPKSLTEELQAADMIIHAGDYTGLRLVEGLREFSKFVGVYGNIDGEEVRKQLGPIQKVTLEGITIGITHPATGGPSFGMKGRIRKILGEVNIAIHGHTHMPYVEEDVGTLFINPGSATGQFPALSRTYAILKLKERPEAQVLKIP